MKTTLISQITLTPEGDFFVPECRYLCLTSYAPIIAKLQHSVWTKCQQDPDGFITYIETYTGWKYSFKRITPAHCTPEAASCAL